MRQRLRHMIRKELIQTLREPRRRMLLIIPPLLQLLIYGFAVNLDVDSARIAWMDQDRSPQSRELRSEFEGSGRFQILATPASDAEMQDLLDRSKVDGVVRVLPGFAHDLERGRSTSVQVLLDGTNSNTASIVAAYANQAILRYASEAMTERQREKLVAGTVASGGPLHPAVPQVEARTRVWFNPDLLSRNYFIPGVVVNIVMLVTLSLTAMAIVREKEIGTMEQLMVTPIRPIELMLGKMAPAAMVGLTDLVLMTTAALVIFGIPFRGNPLVLIASALLFLLTSLGMGLFISTIANTQQQAIMSSSLIAIPTFMLSGFAYPIRNMPIAVQYFTYLNPLRYLIEIVRGIFLKGAGVSVLWPQMLLLLIYGVTVMGLSASSFRKRLD